MNRRTFMHSLTGVAALSALPLVPGEAAQSGSPLELFFDVSRIQSLREKWRLPLFQTYVREVLETDLAADKNFLLKELDVNNHIRHIARANKIVTREAFAWLMTGDRMRLDLAKLALKKILAYPVWDYFLEAGADVIGLQRAPETTIAVSLAYDWLYDQLDEKTRRLILAQLGPKGCEPCYRTLWGLRYPDQVKGWGYAPAAKLEPRDFRRWPYFISQTNLKAIPLSGLAVGAAVLRERHARAADWIEMAQYSYETLARLYSQDGSYPEGGGYGDYTTFHMLMTQAVFERKLKVDLFDRVNYNGFIEFMMGLHMPHHATVDERVNSANRATINSGDMPQRRDSTVNFGDAGGGLQSSVGFYIAGRTRDGLAQHIALHHAREHTPFSIFWYDPTVADEPPGESEHFKHFDLDWVVYRTGYQAEDLLVAMRSGLPANHEHADRNSLIVAAHNDILLADIKHPTYDYTHPSWILRTSPGHNTVLIDGQGHQYHDGREGTNMALAQAKILRKGRRRHLIYWSSDATHAYALVNPDVAYIQRSVFILPDIPLVVVVDTMEKKDKESIFSSRWHVENSDGNGRLRVHDNGFVVHRPNAKLYAVCSDADECTIHQDAMPVPPQYGVYPYVQVDRTKAARRSTLTLAAMPLPADRPDPVIAFGADGLITIDHLGRHFALRLRHIGRTVHLHREV